MVKTIAHGGTFDNDGLHCEREDLVLFAEVQSGDQTVEMLFGERPANDDERRSGQFHASEELFVLLLQSLGLTQRTRSSAHPTESPLQRVATTPLFDSNRLASQLQTTLVSFQVHSIAFDQLVGSTTNTRYRIDVCGIQKLEDVKLQFRREQKSLRRVLKGGGSVNSVLS